MFGGADAAEAWVQSHSMATLILLAVLVVILIVIAYLYYSMYRQSKGGLMNNPGPTHIVHNAILSGGSHLEYPGPHVAMIEPAELSGDGCSAGTSLGAEAISQMANLTLLGVDVATPEGSPYYMSSHSVASSVPQSSPAPMASPSAGAH